MAGICGHARASAFFGAAGHRHLGTKTKTTVGPPPFPCRRRNDGAHILVLNVAAALVELAANQINLLGCENALPASADCIGQEIGVDDPDGGTWRCFLLSNAISDSNHNPCLNFLSATSKPPS
jgi:hypothetical protein